MTFCGVERWAGAGVLAPWKRRQLPRWPLKILKMEVGNTRRAWSSQLMFLGLETFLAFGPLAIVPRAGTISNIEVKYVPYGPLAARPRAAEAQSPWWRNMRLAVADHPSTLRPHRTKFVNLCHCQDRWELITWRSWSQDPPILVSSPRLHIQSSRESKALFNSFKRLSPFTYLLVTNYALWGRLRLALMRPYNMTHR